MPTIPTGALERELRRLYMRWVAQLPKHAHDLHNYVLRLERESIALIELMGGDIARRGAVGDFPAPRRLDLSPHVGTIYNDIEMAAIQAQIQLGLNPRQTARALQQAGVGKGYARLENLARTETVSAYWKNSWDSVDGLDLVMVWGAEDGSRTCAYCLAKDGLVVEDRNTRDHPQGRCTLIPTLPHLIPIRSKGGNPKFQRRPWDGQVPQEVNQFLGQGLDHALVADRRAQTAITGMVSQGWTSREAGDWLLGQHGIDKPALTATGWSQVLRSLENYADTLWSGLKRGKAPQVMYRGGPLNATGLASWTTSLDVAKIYQTRNGGPVFAMEVPKQVFSYRLPNNPVQDEYLLLGTPGVTTPAADGILQGALDGPTTLTGPPM